MKRLIPVLLMGIALVGCAKKKEPLLGERVPVLVKDNVIIPDADLQGQPIILEKSQPNSGWYQTGGDEDQSMPSVILSTKLEKKWSSSIGSGSGTGRKLLSSPVIADGKIYTIDTNSVVRAFDEKTGKEIWQFATGPHGKNIDSIGGGVGFWGERLYVTTAHADVICLDAKTGKQIWHRSVNSPVRAAPVIQDDQVYIITINNQLQVFNAMSGDPLWSHAGISETAGIVGGAPCAISGDVVIVPYSSGEVYALRKENGQQLWNQSLSTFGQVDSISSISHVRARPIIDGDIDGATVFIVSHSGRMKAVDLRTGAVNWEKNIAAVEAPIIGGDYLFMITTDSQLVAIRKADGKINWVKDLPAFADTNKKERIFWTSPILAGERLLIAGSNGHLMTYSAITGEVIENKKLGSQVFISPVVANQTLFVLSDTGRLTAYGS